LYCVSDEYDSADEGEKHADNRAGENYAGAFSDFLQGLIDDFGHF